MDKENTVDDQTAVKLTEIGIGHTLVWKWFINQNKVTGDAREPRGKLPEKCRGGGLRKFGFCVTREVAMVDPLLLPSYVVSDPALDKLLTSAVPALVKSLSSVWGWVGDDQMDEPTLSVRGVGEGTWVQSICFLSI